MPSCQDTGTAIVRDLVVSIGLDWIEQSRALCLNMSREFVQCKNWSLLWWGHGQAWNSRPHRWTRWGSVYCFETSDLWDHVRPWETLQWTTFLRCEYSLSMLVEQVISRSSFRAESTKPIQRATWDTPRPDTPRFLLRKLGTDACSHAHTHRFCRYNMVFSTLSPKTIRRKNRCRWPLYNGDNQVMQSGIWSTSKDLGSLNHGALACRMVQIWEIALQACELPTSICVTRVTARSHHWVCSRRPTRRQIFLHKSTCSVSPAPQMTSMTCTHYDDTWPH
jgi:hypothetical protein